MKKIILLLLVLFSLNIKVQASTQDVYYSEYSDFSGFTEVKIDSSELIDVEIERRYRWYKENVTSEYLLYDEGMSKYESVDLENFQESEFSDWQYEQPTSITGRTIQEKEEYKVRKLKPIQTLMINSFSFSKDTVSLGELEIYVNDEKIDYDSICGGCDGDTTFQESGFVMIDFYEPYYMKDITIKFIDSEKQYINSFEIYAVEPMIDDVLSNIFASYIYKNSEGDDIVITDEDFDIVNPKYEDEVIYDVLNDISSLDSIEFNMKYRYKDNYYYFYNTEIEYTDGYYTEYAGYIKDEKDYKDYYRYRTREKIVIENKMTITRYKDSLEDFIVSTANYDIETDINYLENGVYSVRYITPFQTITKQVTVDIEENDLRKQLEETNKKYNDLINNYNENQKQLDELKNNISIKNEEITKLENINVLNQQQLSSNEVKYQELLNSYNLVKNEKIDIEDDSNYINSLKEVNEKCTSDLSELNLQNEDYEKKLKLSNQANDYLQKSLLDIEQESIDIDKIDIIPLILLSLIIVLLIIIIIKKMSSKN